LGGSSPARRDAAACFRVLRIGSDVHLASHCKSAFTLVVKYACQIDTVTAPIAATGAMQAAIAEIAAKSEAEVTAMSFLAFTLNRQT